ncbi:MAG: hypothetical protein WDN72_11195 [Alphaproteobacteria bacterium]
MPINGATARSSRSPASWTSSAREIERILGRFPPIEAWGGAQYAEPARLLSENPLENLRNIREAAPHLELQALFRGRQGLGYQPISNETLKDLIDRSAQNGIKVFRVFDMMNDMRNVQPSFDVLNAYNAQHPDAQLVIEGAISYISEPPGEKRAWTIDEYADYAVKLAKAGCHEIAIKNYAGVGGEEMPELIRTIRARLKEAGYEQMPVNLHMHGSNADLAVEALREGAGKVDVAIGELSDGPSHPNLRTVLGKLLAAQGYDIDSEEVRNHPVLRQLEKIEQVIPRRGPEEAVPHRSRAGRTARR